MNPDRGLGLQRLSGNNSHLTFFFFSSSATGKAALSVCSIIISASTVQKSSLYLVAVAIISVLRVVFLHSPYEKFNIRKKKNVY